MSVLIIVGIILGFVLFIVDIARKKELHKQVIAQVINTFESVERSEKTTLAGMSLSNVTIVSIEPLYKTNWYDFLTPFRNNNNSLMGYFIYPKEAGFGSKELCIAISSDNLEDVVKYFPKELNLVFKK